MNMTSTENTKKDRLLSLDALRGFDMLWIAGGEYFIISLAALTGWPFLQWAAVQMEHVEWQGFHFYDMIFPLFLFIAGVSMPFSIVKRQTTGGKYAENIHASAPTSVSSHPPGIDL